MSGPVVLVLRVLVALALYLFLGLAIWMMWQDLRRTARSVADRRVPPIRLELLAKQNPSIARSFSQPEIVVGRDPACDLAIPDSSVSARHALLSYHHGQWWLDDLSSSNGTQLNREKVVTATVLASGDEILFGRARLLVSLPGDGNPPVGKEREDNDG